MRDLLATCSRSAPRDSWKPDGRVPSRVSALPKTRQALAYAGRAHAGQHRDVDGAPFIEHPAEVAALLYHVGAPDHVIAAGALHDTIEKTSTSADGLSRSFGPRITRLVLAVTDDDRITNYHERKAAERERAASVGDEALMILAADNISKVRELQLEAASARRRGRPMASQSRLRRVAHYRECLLLFAQRLPDSSLLATLRAEFERLPAAFTEAPPHRA